MGKGIIKTTITADASNYNRALKEAKKSLESFGNAIGVNISSLTKFGISLGAISGAVKVVKNAFFSTEKGVDSWGRTMEAASSSYNAFCQSLATGSFDGLLRNLGSIITRAKETYNALDNLKTIGGIISNQESMLNARRAKAMKTIKDPNATEAQKSAARAELQSIQVQKGAATEQTKALNNDYIKKALRNQAGVLSDEEYNKYYPLIVKSLYDSAAKDALDQVNIKKTGKRTVVNGQGVSSTIETSSVVNVGDLFTDKFREGLNPYIQAYWNADTRKYTDERADNRIMGSATGNTGGGRNEKEVDMSFKVNPKSEFSKSDIAKILSDEPLAKKLGLTVDADNASGLRDMISGQTTPGDVVDPFKAKLRSNADNYDYSKIEEAGKKAQEAWLGAANAIGTVGSALAGIENPAAKVFGIIAEAIANVALSMAQALTKKESQMGGVWGWIAAAAAGTATMISTISAIKSATSGSYAEGGIIPGNSYSGDSLMANVNSGELILNKAQQGVLANRLQNSAFGQMQLSATIKGEDIRLALNNGSRRRGKGEYVTSK